MSQFHSSWNEEIEYHATSQFVFFFHVGIFHIFLALNIDAISPNFFPNERFEVGIREEIHEGSLDLIFSLLYLESTNKIHA